MFCGRRRSPMLLGTAVVVGLAPIYNLPGDYFEMGSIITTRVVTLLGGGTEVAFKCLRSDDIFRLFEEVFTQAGPLGIASPGRFAAALVLIFVSLGVAILLAFLTYSLGRAFGCLFIRPRPAHP